MEADTFWFIDTKKIVQAEATKKIERKEKKRRENIHKSWKQETEKWCLNRILHEQSKNRSFGYHNFLSSPASSYEKSFER